MSPLDPQVLPLLAAFQDMLVRITQAIVPISLTGVAALAVLVLLPRWLWLWAATIGGMGLVLTGLPG